MNGKILTMQDLSCVGQCSLTVALPILSRYGLETVVLPTAVLSNHTAFKTWSYLDLTPELENIYRNWKENGFKFDAFLLGYLGKKQIMDAAEKCFDEFASEDAPVIIDPAFGDNGALYGGFDGEYVAAMRNLLRRADIILPNLTEVTFMTGGEYRDCYDRAYLEGEILKLSRYTKAAIIVTGVEFGDGKIGEAIFRDGRFEYVFDEKLPRRSHGTGDIFAAVFAARYLNGADFADSCAAAGRFVADSIRATEEAHFYGVRFEKALAGETNG